MNPLYNGAVHLIAACATRNVSAQCQNQKMIHGQSEAIEHIRATLGARGCDVWIHAASLGEFEQGRPMIERLKREQPDIKILLTFFSPLRL